MRYTLAIDCGNTAIKAALFHGPTLENLLFAPGIEGLKGQLKSGELPMLDGAIFSSVRPHIAAELETFLHTLTPNVVRLSYKTPLPIGIEYEHAATLGVDRIAAAVGAYALYPGRELLVVDAGTAVTYDRVTADGRFVGGNIAPGVQMRLDALHHFTAALPEIVAPSHAPSSPWGSSTTSALTCGAVYGIIGEATYYRSLLPADALVVLTGGSASLIAEVLPFEAREIPHLVTDGLNRILLYNEDK